MGLDVRSVMVVGVLLSLLTVLLLAQVGRNFPPARRRALRIWTVGLMLQPMAWFLLVIIGILTMFVFKSSSAWVYYESEGR